MLPKCRKECQCRAGLFSYRTQDQATNWFIELLGLQHSVELNFITFSEPSYRQNSPPTCIFSTPGVSKNVSKELNSFIARFLNSIP